MNKRKVNLSTFIIMLILLLGIIVFFAFAVLNAYDAVTPKDEKIAELERSVSDLKRELELEKFISGNDENLNDESLGTNNEDVKKYKDEITKLQNEIMGYKTKLQDFEKDVEGAENFKIGRYQYDYDIVMEQGEGEATLSLGVGFYFKEDKTIYANLAGHETGAYSGTYEVFKDTVKCTFTEYENESGGVSDQKLEKEIVVVLKRIRDMQLSFLTQDGKTSSKDFNVKDEDIRVYTYMPETVKQ